MWNVSFIFGRKQLSRDVFRSSHWRGFGKKSVPKHFAEFTRKHLYWSLFLIKLLAGGLIWKRNSRTGVFLWVLRNFEEHLFCRPSANGGFCVLKITCRKNIAKKIPGRNSFSYCWRSTVTNLLKKDSDMYFSIVNLAYVWK